MPKPLLLLISAPSGAGKTTLGDGLLRQNPTLRRVITCTTRAPRPGEVDGVDYHFLSREDFAARIEAGEFLEHATVYGRSYGTLSQSVRNLLAQGMDALLTIDVQGAESVRRLAALDETLGAALVTLFLCPASRPELVRRLAGRGTETPEILAQRLAAASEEIRHWRQFHYLLVSESREDDLRRAQAVLEAERIRGYRAQFEFGE
jgi:guanylate kinase